MTRSPARFLLAAILAAGLLGGCTGYQLGGSKPAHLREVDSVYVAPTRNQTLLTRASALATNNIVDALTRDGTYQVATLDAADARLETTILRVDYQQVRASTRDTLSSEELEMTLILSWKLIDASNPLEVLESGSSSGSTRFFADPNLQTARQTALTDALKRATDSLVARLADGF
ncbi:MAG: hypothetical protein HKN82_09100 [Akkermansiaceae bacterium]|nr:hypothetical protein [Akkermansiaceae bacterium]NNM30980.1 hypothetical protein [Akkermansiaceae bacterium]